MIGQGLVFALDQIGSLAEHQAQVISEQNVRAEEQDRIIAEKQGEIDHLRAMLEIKENSD